MTKSQIINEIKGATSPEVQMAFQVSDAKNNFSFKFGKTSQYWSAAQWSIVAAEVKKEMA